MHDVTTLDFARIAQDLQIRKVQVESVVQLLDESNTVPFITRYRKERTGGLNEEVIRQIQARVGFLRLLAERKQTILKSIENQGKLTDELRAAVLGAESSKRLEDLYLPYKPKKRTLASVARDRGLEPLALAVWNRDPVAANLNEVLPTMVNPEKELNSPADVLAGVQHILAEQIAETADVRATVRSILWETGRLSTSKNENLGEGQGLEYKDYFQFTEPVRQIPPHRILAINRGEKEGSLKVRLEWKTEAAQQAFCLGFPDRPPLLPVADHPHADFLKAVAEDALSRLLLPSLERELRRELTERAEDHAVNVFARNLRSLLLQAPLQGRRVLAIDPGFRTGCKVAVLDEHGNLLEDGVIFPHQLHGKGYGKKGAPAPAPAAAAATGEATPPPPPEKKEEPPPVPPRREEAQAKLEELIRKHQVHVIAIGNGTACRETEEFVSELIGRLDTRCAAPADHGQVGTANGAGAVPAAPAEAPAGDAPPSEAPAAASPVTAPAPAPAPAADVPPAPAPAGPAPELAYVIVNEAGASVYSASAVGREEFPDYDATLRGTISIGRRLQDPLSELVKIDPQSIGVGLYQHDVNPRELKESLEAVIESSVNHVGVDLNTASVPLLRYVAGLNQLVARDVVDYRKQHGPFRNREQLREVPNIGSVRYVQAAGFLKIAAGDNPLDQTWIHPESYPVARRLLADLGYDPEILRDKHKTEEMRERLKSLSPEEVSARLEVGVPTLRDILEALSRPGRDPREDLPPPIFKKGILKLEDLQPGMELKGTVLNVVDFGAFVDIGLKDSGLVHISQMANRYIKNPYDVVAVGDVVTVWVLTVDHERRRVSLTMIKPGTQRKPAERKPAQPRPQRGSRPPRGRRPAPPHAQVAVPGQGAPSAAVAQEPTKTVGEAASGPPPRQAAPPPRPAPPPRRPKRHAPKPKLSQAALEGKAPLRTFSELKALYEAKQKEEPPQGQATAVQEPRPSPGASGGTG
ncbi:MAG TPA: Tex family protein [Gemmataceae bacterium]|nr:Tex family protein [Gemmataceae bacterium]